jgi:transcriptional adapter 2-alpha
MQNTANSRNVKSRSNISAIQACTEVVGYLPKRGDFDQEYDMDAELLLADMEFFEEDTEENIQLKNSVIELYNARLDERIRRKKFVIERGLLDLKRTQKYERKRSKEEREIINSMKIFARFNTEEEHQRIVNNLIKERLLREVIEQIKFFRSKGLTSLD